MTQRKTNIIIALLVFLLVFVIYYNRIVMINGPGQASVIFKPFEGGVDTDVTYGEGMYFILPWNTSYQFNVREQAVNDTLSVLVRDGVNVNIRVNYRYYPIKDSLSTILSRFGPNYEKVFVKPEVAYAVRERMSAMDPEEIYSSKLRQLKVQANQNSLDRVADGSIKISDVLIIDIQLPHRVTESIENKLREEQLSQEYDFKISIAEKERKIKTLEAQAIKISEDTISKGLTENYLRFRQIEALEKLSKSPNAKTIVLPANSKTPILLSGQ
ncbi:prohibitin family protein [Mucilaginibacter calamicampi]|uniref:Prohibitin family protein n=1 Tax=Mucilaginibacter calamicampi TaxID=1302352 RepID=A0ABW2YUR1_9SPHI